MHATERTLEVIRQNGQWAVAVLACESSRISARGTRSQSMALKAKNLASSDETLPELLEIEQYVADQAIMEAGITYLAILIRDQAFDRSDTWKVIQAAPASGADPNADVQRLVARLTDAL